MNFHLYSQCEDSVCTYDIALSVFNIVTSLYSMITRMVTFIAMKGSRLIKFFVCSINGLNTYMNMCTHAHMHTHIHMHVPKHIAEFITLVKITVKH